MPTPPRRLADPPRRLPRAVKVQLLLGQTSTQLAWAGFGVAMIFVWLFTLDSELVTWLEFRVPFERTEGTTTAVDGLWDQENYDRDLYRVSFRYQVGDRPYEGVAYTTDPPEGPGEPVTVEHLVARPEVARVEGTRNRRWRFNPFPILVTLGALGTALSRLPRGLREIRLLREGVLVEGELVEKRPAGSSAGVTFHEVELRYRAPLAAKAGTPYRRIEAAEEHLVRYTTTDAGELPAAHREPVVVDPRRPRQAAPLHGLPGLVAIDADGLPFCHRSATLPLLLPLLAVGAHTLVAFLW
jgi:hypothetical protein